MESVVVSVGSILSICRNKCTIRIYTISGNLVDILEHDSSMSDGQESWNLVSQDGMNIAYGVYVLSCGCARHGNENRTICRD